MHCYGPLSIAALLIAAIAAMPVLPFTIDYSGDPAEESPE